MCPSVPRVLDDHTHTYFYLSRIHFVGDESLGACGNNYYPVTALTEKYTGEPLCKLHHHCLNQCVLFISATENNALSVLIAAPLAFSKYQQITHAVKHRCYLWTYELRKLLLDVRQADQAFDASSCLLCSVVADVCPHACVPVPQFVGPSQIALLGRGLRSKS